ncbi:hypothetical protein HAX54_020195, partial [Datura stramonium]|nr:hypothetical protein [Datura stramonium]
GFLPRIFDHNRSPYRFYGARELKQWKIKSSSYLGKGNYSALGKITSSSKTSRFRDNGA